MEKEPLYQIKSMVRNIRTRAVRADQPTAHRFKQYVLGNSRRLIRNRNLVVPESLIKKHLDELREKEAAGILWVFTQDGRRVDLSTMQAEPAKPPAPQPHPPMDSAANDKPSGNPLPKFPGGSLQGDPAAQRAALRLREEVEDEEEGSEDSSEPEEEDQWEEESEDSEDTEDQDR